MSCVLCHFNFACHLLTYAFLIHSSTLIKAISLSNSSRSWKATHCWDHSKIINPCLTCHLPNMLAFSWCHDIPQHRSHIINSICIVVFCLNKIVSMIFQYNNTQLWPSFQHYVEYHQVCFSCWTFDILSKLVRPLIMFSLNSPKPTKG